MGDTRNIYRCILAPVGLIGLIHVIGGLSIAFTDSAAHITAHEGLGMLAPNVKGLILFLVGCMAITARIYEMPKQFENALIAPQQIVLLVQLWGIAVAIVAGRYPDGTVPVVMNYWGSVMFMLADQAPWIILCLSHAAEFLLADCVVLRLRRYYEAKLAEEQTDRIQAQRLVALHQETKFWESLN